MGFRIDNTHGSFWSGVKLNLWISHHWSQWQWRLKLSTSDKHTIVQHPQVMAMETEGVLRTFAGLVQGEENNFHFLSRGGNSPRRCGLLMSSSETGSVGKPRPGDDSNTQHWAKQKPPRSRAYFKPPMPIPTGLCGRKRLSSPWAACVARLKFPVARSCFHKAYRKNAVAPSEAECASRAEVWPTTGAAS